MQFYHKIRVFFLHIRLDFLDWRIWRVENKYKRLATRYDKLVDRLEYHAKIGYPDMFKQPCKEGCGCGHSK